VNWTEQPTVKPSFIGVQAIEGDLADLARHIDWTPFFASWELIGRFPAILEDDIVGEAATDLYRDAQAMLKRIVEEQWFTAKGVVGFWPAQAVGDDIAVFSDESRATELARFHTLRQQMDKTGGKANLALSDFVAPADKAQDWIGAFAVTAGHGETEIAAKYKAAGDDYNAILSAALADRLAEAFAESLHRQVRTGLWGYAPDEPFDIDALIGEKYQGIRPAPGYPAQPDHTEKATLFKLLDAENHTGMALTESYAMSPPASVSGLYFAHPQAHYFGVGKIDRDQVADYAQRKGWDLATAERWLAPILAYDPVAAAREAAA
jgi:5-methyltetrahydrofolate--homocysteine methyltransferase